MRLNNSVIKFIVVVTFMVFVIVKVQRVFAWNTNAPSSSVLIFTSFSMPKESLRGWLKQADTIKAPVIIRGLINNSFRDTTKAVMELLPDNRGGFQLDPTLFRRFHIEKVPAVVVITPTCLSNPACQEADIVYGDVTLDYALKEIIKQNDSLTPYAQEALKKLTEQGI